MGETLGTNYGPPPQGQQPSGQWQQPQQFYSSQQWQGQQQGYPPPMMQPPPKKKPWHKTPMGVLIIIGAIVGVLMICGSIGAAITQTSKVSTAPDTANIMATTAPTQVPSAPTQVAKPLAWKTVQTFSGNGAKKTGTFTVPDHWRINWTCKPDLVIGAAPLYISVYGSDGSFVDPNAVGTECKTGNTSGTSEEHQAGQVYLDLNTGLDWSVTVQALQ